MPTKKLTMRGIHRLMTLRFCGGSATRVISRELGISHSTVREYLARIIAAAVIRPLPAELTACSPMAAFGPEHAITRNRTGRRLHGS
jgi:hypothetical protein